jgi:hypothetical protein
VPNSILETWTISIEQIRRESILAYNILLTQAFLGNENIPFELVSRTAYGLSSHSETNRDGQDENTVGMDDDSESDRDEEDLLSAVSCLCEFSFFVSRANGRTYDMHKLVQEAARYSLRGQNDETYYARAALRLMTDLCSSWCLKFRWRGKELRQEQGTFEQYLIHAHWSRLHWSANWVAYTSEPIATARLLMHIWTYLNTHGRCKEMESVINKAYELRKRALGEKHPDTLERLTKIGSTMHRLRRYRVAEEVGVTVVALQREVLGEKHPMTLRSMGTIARTYQHQNKFVAAEQIRKQVLRLRIEVFGERHSDILGSMVDLAEFMSL